MKKHTRTHTRTQAHTRTRTHTRTKKGTHTHTRSFQMCMTDLNECVNKVKDKKFFFVCV